MPLAFNSLSHGTIAFGFFNIESDMLLCDRYFFFANDFCSYIGNLAENAGEESYKAFWQVYFIETPEDIGDLAGAIQGNRFDGFLGELYRRFPFPVRSEGFKQKTEGFQTQSHVSEIIAKYARPLEISFSVSSNGREIKIGVYRFNRSQFQKLILYVWRGGYPRWKDEIRPGYVTQMRDNILQNCAGVFESIIFED
ncbi:MAG: hypothetical protein KAR42_17820 [candidate division Zixibacteria bacterium]|nr:hypothetical protein [candidate division Zixibacteria bacterium]